MSLTIASIDAPTVILVFWPFSIVMLGSGPDGVRVWVLLQAIALNGLLYGVVALLWLALLRASK
jgi:hypothetical protein